MFLRLSLLALCSHALRSNILIEEEGGDGSSGTDDGGMYHITVSHSLSYGAKHSTRNTLCSYTRHAYICYKDSALCVVAWCGHLTMLLCICFFQRKPESVRRRKTNA